jgi:iron complex outermembrane recepter protein
MISGSKKRWGMCLLLMALLMPRVGHADEGSNVLSEVVVEEKRNETATTLKTESVIGTTENINKSTINIQGGGAQTNVYNAISTIPGVDIRTYDPYGMNVAHKIRGKSDRNIGEVLEGLPLKGIGPGGGVSTLMDLENVESIDVSKGAVSADSGFGYGSAEGMVDMHILQPSENFRGTVKQAFGSYDFSRSYGRIDSGNIGNVLKGFVSASYTDADKWKGGGDSPDGRQNLGFGLASTAGQPVEWELNSFYNHDISNSYRNLSYDQTKNLSKNYKFDFSSDLTGNSAKDAYYYDYNRQDFETYAFLGKLKVPISDRGALMLKPYYLRDHGFSYAGGVSSDAGYITDWLVDHETYGSVLEYEHSIMSAKVKVGYWYGEDEPPGPPTTQKKRTIASGTGDLVFDSWTKLVDATDNSHFNSPYLTADMSIYNFRINAGLRYLWWTTPSLTSYKTKGIGDVSASKALDLATDKKFHVEGDTYDLFLPNIGISRDITSSITLRASYGHTYDTPQYGFGGTLDSLYSKGYPEAKLQDLWKDTIRPEEADNFDLGAKFTFDRFFVEPTLFYSLTKYVSGSFYDPVLKETYSQNTGEAVSMGAEMLMGYRFTKNLDATLSFMYNSYECTSDYTTATGYVIQAEGNQMPNSPLYLGNLSLNWEIGGVMISPTLRYLGKFYADVENKYSVDPYFLLDLGMSYKINYLTKNGMTLRLWGTNLLNEEYIASVSGGNTSIGETSQTYTVGAPRAVVASLQVDF